MQIANIDLQNSAWTPIGGFAGTYDGGKYNISNLTISTSNKLRTGLFEALQEGGTIQNVRLKVTRIDTSTTSNNEVYVGGIAGGNLNGSIKSSYNRGKIESNSYNATFSGGISGSNSGTIQYCYSTGITSALQITNGTAVTHGITSGSNGTVSNSYYKSGTAQYSFGTSNEGILSESQMNTTSFLPYLGGAYNRISTYPILSWQ